MTRKEEIEKAAKRYVDNKLNLNKSIKSAFIDGIEWADKHPINVWYLTTELPRNKFIALLSDGDVICGKLIYNTSGNNDYIVSTDYGIKINFSFVVKWAYISDLLPKGDGK